MPSGQIMWWLTGRPDGPYRQIRKSWEDILTNAIESEELTRVGPGTPMGELMRQYWIPAAKSSEVASGGDPLRLMLLGEKLIAFRDHAGRAVETDPLEVP